VQPEQLEMSVSVDADVDGLDDEPEIEFQDASAGESEPVESVDSQDDAEWESDVGQEANDVIDLETDGFDHDESDIAARSEDDSAAEIEATSQAVEETHEPVVIEDEPIEDTGLSDEEREARLSEVLELVSEAEDEERYDLLIEATGLSIGAEQVRWYLEATQASPRNVKLHWSIGQHLKLSSEQATDIAAGLDRLAADDFDGASEALNAHRLVFGAVHLDEGRTVDFKLRDLVKKATSKDAEAFQIQQFIQGNKWRNVQQLLTTEHGGDPGEARLYALKTMAYLATERLGEPDKAAEFWRQVHQVDKQDPDARAALLDAYESLGKWKEFAEVLRLDVEAIPFEDTEEKLAGLRRLVRTISTHLRQDAQVI
jgi:hypothetical protein